MAAKSSPFPPLPLLFLFLFLVSSFPAKISSSSHQEEEKLTLLSIKAHWGNPPALDSWTSSSSSSHCNWTGIGCSGGFVTALTLSNVGLDQPIPAAVCSLANLSVLDLGDNNLPGPFPTALYSCPSLTYLDLSQNLFVGALPPNIDLLSPRTLTYLSLAANNFTGDIPASISRLSSLHTLLLNDNLFNGTFPSSLGRLSSLRTLTLAYNPFAPSPIPPELGGLTSLTYLFMAKMNLIGEIPESFAKLVSLQHLDLSMNSLTGPIPAGIWMLESLQDLFLYANRLAREIRIDGDIKALSLANIDISINQLNGSMPDAFGELKNLSGLAVFFNQLSGEIPASLGLLPSLTDIRLFNNSLTGPLPPELGKHSDLWNLDVDGNQLSGELPDHLCSRRKLSSLVVSNNNFSGKIPDSIGDCPMLDNIQLQQNRFSGEIPAGMWSAANLTTVKIQRNAFSGTLPDRLPYNLSRLEMGSNSFSGNIPSSAVNLRVFIADGNRFSGEVPAALPSGMSRLQVLSLGGNQLSGSIPSGMSSLKYLTDLSLRGNRLSGVIPGDIGLLPVLTSLDLSSNQLSGNIPPEIGELKPNVLNLSSNQLSGEIPASLDNQAYDRSFLSNPGLCSSAPFLIGLHDCRSGPNQKSKLATELRALLLALGAILLLALVVLGFMLARAYRRRRQDADDLAAWKLTSFHAVDFSEDSIFRGLTDENQIGSGGSGSVYRVALGARSGEVVAVKKIWSSRKLDAKLEKEFEAEVQILGSIRHANIVKLLCCISGTGSKLLVYEYMGNGSLDRWLHRRRRGSGGAGPPTLDWPTRLGIAVGAARGLCYMHHDCSPPIVHRDVKSSNILLDSELGAKIADFGLARMLVRAGEPESVSAIAGTFGYMAPECGYARKVSEKMDVYSFGVVLLELVTGREANGEGEDECLAEWAWRQYQDGGLLIDAVDEEIRDPSHMDEIEVVLTLGLICTGSLPSTRPTMKEVLDMLVRCDPIKAMSSSGKLRGAQFLQKKGSKRVNPSDAEEDDAASLV